MCSALRVSDQEDGHQSELITLYYIFCWWVSTGNNMQAVNVPSALISTLTGSQRLADAGFGFIRH